MTTLISTSNGNCDARCYNATGFDCDCVCGGMNHGKGARVAIQNTRQFVEKMIEEFVEKNPDTEDIVSPFLNQLSFLED